MLSLLDDKPHILRPGAVTAEQIAELLQEPVDVAAGAEDANAPRSPGRLLSHYAPSLPVRLNAAVAEAGEALLGFGGGGLFDDCVNPVEVGSAWHAPPADSAEVGQ